MENEELEVVENNNEELSEEELEELEHVDIDTDKFTGYFHERDSLSENNIVNEVKTSFLEYSMSVITSRALPDLRDGLKPVHRRILWSMYESGYTPDKPHRKCATTVGYVMGHYHPHGDSSIYEAMVRMAQDFNERYLLVDGHGNFGNIEGDGAAAMRYTESRLSKLSLELLRDIRKNTVDMDDNFDVSMKEPKVLPSRFPNLGEVIDGCVACIDNPDIELPELMKYVKGPDFPTGGIILGNSGIRRAYETGRGSITIRSRAEIEEHGNHSNIVITEVPYGVNTMELKNKVAELVHNKVLDGISDYHTDLKDGVKITITLKKDANPQVVLNNLYKHTAFQVNYGIIFLMLDDMTPKTLGLKDILMKYLDHQKEVIIRRTQFDLEKAEARVHILEGLKIALDNLDAVIKIIRGSETDEEAKQKLNPNIEIISEGMAIIPTKWKTEILCYEFKGKVKDNEFLVKKLASNGVNRVSIGIESFNKEKLKFMERKADFNDIRTKINLLRYYGIDNINLDLMYGIPGETLEILKKDLKMILKLNPSHISTYSLIIEDHTKIKINGAKNIDEELEVKMYEYICKKLKQSSYHHYEVSNFALNNKESIHNLAYWNNEEYYGFGLGASGYINGFRYDNTRNIDEYLKGNYHLNEALLSKQETMEYEVMLGLRKMKGINLQEFYDKYDINIQEVFPVKPLVKNKDLIYKNGYLFINPERIYVMNEILNKMI